MATRLSGAIAPARPPPTRRSRRGSARRCRGRSGSGSAGGTRRRRRTRAASNTNFCFVREPINPSKRARIAGAPSRAGPARRPCARGSRRRSARRAPARIGRPPLPGAARVSLASGWRAAEAKSARSSAIATRKSHIRAILAIAPLTCPPPKRTTKGNKTGSTKTSNGAPGILTFTRVARSVRIASSAARRSAASIRGSRSAPRSVPSRATIRERPSPAGAAPMAERRAKGIPARADPWLSRPNPNYRRSPRPAP